MVASLDSGILSSLLSSSLSSSLSFISSSPEISSFDLSSIIISLSSFSESSSLLTDSSISSIFSSSLVFFSSCSLTSFLESSVPFFLSFFFELMNQSKFPDDDSDSTTFFSSGSCELFGVSVSAVGLDIQGDSSTSSIELSSNALLRSDSR